MGGIIRPLEVVQKNSGLIRENAKQINQPYVGGEEVHGIKKRETGRKKKRMKPKKLEPRKTKRKSQ